MLKLLIFLFLFYGIPISLNAAGVYDKTLIIDDKNTNEKPEDLKKSETIILKNNDKNKSEYEKELITILKKNTIKLRLVDNVKVEAGVDGFTQLVSVTEIDQQALLEADLDWLEIKSDLKNVSDFFYAFNKKAENSLDQYLGQTNSANMIFISNIQTIRHPEQHFSYYEKNIFNVSYKNNEHVKAENDPYQIPQNYNEQLKRLDEDNYDRINGEKNIYNIFYLWKMYSDTIIWVVSIMTILWFVMVGLIRILIWNGRRVD